MTQVTRLFDFLIINKINILNSDALNTKQWCLIKTSTQEYIEQANAISRALLNGNQKK
jgi:long-chain acyl-CoA synthetase